jgi:hypothetical protein
MSSRTRRSEDLGDPFGKGFGDLREGGDLLDANMTQKQQGLAPCREQGWV